jgi:hypothetical protein
MIRRSATIGAGHDMSRLRHTLLALALLVSCDDDPVARLDAGSDAPAATGGRGGSGATGGSGGSGGATGGSGGATGGSDGGTGGSGGGTADSGGADGGPRDQATDVPADIASDPCGGCAGGLRCLECPKGGPAAKYLCTTTCGRDQDCLDPTRPKCNIDTTLPGPPSGICTASDEICRWGSRCAGPDTPIATPEGDRPIAALRVGDLVLSTSAGRIVAVPILQTIRVPVSGHHVVRVTLDSGASLEISEGHPTADGRTFADLAPGTRLGSATVVSVQSARYGQAFTHDILPASPDGSYFAAGALVGSTLAPGR